MKRALIAVAAVGAFATAAPAFAQSWLPINARQAVIERRIDRGIENGSLTRREAMRLRGEFRDIARLEARYRASNGLQGWERTDLDRRFDRLSAQIREERHDAQNRYGVGRDAGLRHDR